MRKFIKRVIIVLGVSVSVYLIYTDWDVVTAVFINLLW